MSTAAARHPFITVEEYLEGEMLAAVKHEYVNGRVDAMAGPGAMSGASVRHNEISLQTAMLLKDFLKGSPCRTFLLELKVKVQDEAGGNFFYYPDVIVTCDPTEKSSHVIEHPKLVIEVLSPSTWRHDCGEKLTNYRHVPSIEEIVLIAQDWPEITLHRRSEGWKPQAFNKPDALIRLESTGFEVPLAAFYESTDLRGEADRPWYLEEHSDG